jgi:hypothetical protein
MTRAPVALAATLALAETPDHVPDQHGRRRDGQDARERRGTPGGGTGDRRVDVGGRIDVGGTRLGRETADDEGARGDLARIAGDEIARALDHVFDLHLLDSF